VHITRYVRCMPLRYIQNKSGNVILLHIELHIVTSVNSNTVDENAG
jgi:hypothetical protein